MYPDLNIALAILGIALAVDLLLGEYPRVLHPVVWIGKTISALIRLAPRTGWWRQLLFGGLLATGMCVAGVAITLLAMHLAAVEPVLQIVVGAFLLKASFALRALGQAAHRVRASLEKDDLAGARLKLCALCSRDPSDLNAQELAGASIQSVAENTSDSFVAPLFYYCLLGVPGAVGYRVVNTLDAMMGYRGEYEALGKASARLDDLANWVPARLTAAVMLLVGLLSGRSTGAGWKILRRDGGKTPSPNGGRPMAVMAGLLGVQLEKKGVYVLGDAAQPLTPAKIGEAWRLAAGAGVVAAGMCAAGSVGVFAFWSLL
jgi:adenosylcobinamide-phosphate synthase